jgi:hypothetical protein
LISADAVHSNRLKKTAEPFVSYFIYQAFWGGTVGIGVFETLCLNNELRRIALHVLAPLHSIWKPYPNPSSHFVLFLVVKTIFKVV